MSVPLSTIFIRLGCQQTALFAVLYALLTNATAIASQPTFVAGDNPAPAGKIWKPVIELSDDFEAQQLDASKWQSEPTGNGWGWLGRPPALFRSENVRLQDGKMCVTVGKLDEPVVHGKNTFTHQGAIVRSIHTCQPGWYYECRMKANATVMSSTFWLMTKDGGDKRLELDIQECVGLTSELTPSWAKNWDGIFHSNMIDWSNGGRIQLQNSVPTPTKNHERFYVYGAWWKSPEEVRFYLDGKYTYSIKPKNSWDLPAHLQMAIETYDWNPIPDDGGLIDTGTWDQRTTQYDWIRTWKLVDPTHVSQSKRIATPAKSIIVEATSRQELTATPTDDVFARASTLTQEVNKQSDARTSVFPYGNVPESKPDLPLSAAMQRIYEGTYHGIDNVRNELFSRFKYTPIQGFDYNDQDGTISRRDSSKIIRVGGQYYVWYTHRQTASPPNYDGGANEIIPSRDWDLSEIWYATSTDGFTWTEQGVAVPRNQKPHPGWRSVSTPDILVWKGKYYLYYQAYLAMPGSSTSSGTNGDDCPVSASVADSPNGPWTPCNKIVVENGPPGSWDQFVIHDPYPLVRNGQIYLYYKGEYGGTPLPVRAQGLAIADHPFGPFKKHPLNPVINSGHETALFPFRSGLAALVSRHGLEHNTIQYAEDGVNFNVAAITSLLPIAPGAYVPDAFTGTQNGRGITWGLTHFRNLGRDKGKSHSMLARFDCDLSLDVHDVEMKETDIFNDPEISFKFPLSDQQRKRIQAETSLSTDN